MAKKVLCYILTFILVIFLIALSFVHIFSNTILKEEYVISKLEEEKYYERTSEEIQDGFKNYILQSGLDESVITDLYDKEKVKQDVNKFIHAIYENESIEVDTIPIQEKLENNIEKVIKENNKKVGKEEQEALNTFTETIVETYRDGIVYSKKTAEPIAKIVNKVTSILEKVKIVFYLMPVVLLVILVVLNIKNIKEILKYIGISLLSAGIFVMLPKIISGFAMSINNILILNQTVSNFVQNVIYDIMNKFMIVGIAAMVVGVLTIMFGNMGKEEKES